MDFTAMDADPFFDDFIGNGSVDMTVASKHEWFHHVVELHNGKKNAGKLHIVIAWLNRTADASAHQRATCRQTTTGTCRFFGCDSADRGEVICVHGKCVCD